MSNWNQPLLRGFLVGAIVLFLAGASTGAVLWHLSNTPVQAANSPDASSSHAEDDDHDHAEGPVHEDEPHPEDADEVSHEHDEHGEKGAHEDHEEGTVRISADVLQEFGIEVATAQPGALETQIELPGEIVMNADTMAHVVPRVSGIVRDVRKAVGDEVKEGEVLAVVESRELAQAKADYFAAGERLELAQANFAREKGLWEEKISAEREYLEARQALAEARIETTSAEQQLHALGFTEAELEGLRAAADAVYTRYEVTAPIGGIIIEKHMTLGESVDSETNVFTIADLSSVWVNITVYQKDLMHVEKGQPVEIRIEHNIPDAHGEIAFVNPALDESTRTTFARVVLENPQGHWRPGLFVTGIVKTGSTSASVVVPRSAIIEVEGKNTVFLRTGEGFRSQEVELGSVTEAGAEVVSGLSPGDRYAVTNVITLKAQMNSAALEHAGHTH